MCSKRFACFIIHKLLCITVVRADKHCTAVFFNRFHSSSYALIHCFYCLDCSAFHTGMTYHVRVCKVNNDYIILISLNCLC